MTTPDRARVRLAEISPRAFEHPADRAALTALRKVRGFDQVLRWLSGLVGGRGPRWLALASTVRVDARQFPDIHRLVQDGVSLFHLPDTPETVALHDPSRTARTSVVGQR